MKSNFSQILMLGVFVFLCTVIIKNKSIFSVNNVYAASVPNVITYQGKLLVGGSAATTSQAMMFILYDAPTGGNIRYTAAGTLLSPSAITVYPTQGLFSINLGDAGTNAVDPSVFANYGSLYLEVRVGADILVPRKRISATPYAFNAKYIDGIGINTVSSTQYIPVSDASGNFDFNHITSTGISAGTSTFSAITLGGVTKTAWPSSGYFFALSPTSTYNGAFTVTIGLTTYHGYQAANQICNQAYTGAHFCRTDEIEATIADKDISSLFTTNNSGWIAEGPPGYTANSNDCNGWMSSDAGMLGAFWLYNTDGGGAGWLVNCSVQKAISCCK